MKTFKQYLKESDDLFMKRTSIDYTKAYKTTIKSAYETAITLLNSNNEIPQHFIDLISKNLYYSFDISRKLINKNIEIPKQLLDTIIKSTTYTIVSNLAWNYINYSKDIFPNIPPELINKIKENEISGRRFIELLNDRLEEMKSKKQIMQKSEYIEKFQQFLKDNPEFLAYII
jgi:hypothetical protein